MQTDLQNPPPVSVGAAIFKTPGNWRRMIALVLAILAILMPVTRSMFLGIRDLHYLPLLPLLFPILLTTAMVAPAIPRLITWLRTFDIAAAVLGTIISITLASRVLLADSGPNAMRTIEFAPGAYALFAATVAAVLIALVRFPRTATT